MIIGTKNEIKLTVTKEKTAAVVGSGLLEVFATPAMIALMEQTASESVMSMLEEGATTVGVKINVEHLAATPVGMEVRCVSTLVAAEGRKLCFEIEAFDEAGLIGKAYHERFIVFADRFMEKTNGKLQK
jgi:predicted thioesterase